VAAEILKLRAERARFWAMSFAAYKLETEMAKTPEAVRDLLMRVWSPARARAEADAAVLEAMMHATASTGGSSLGLALLCRQAAAGGA
jgi:peptidyl-dipeptidase Dcp